MSRHLISALLLFMLSIFIMAIYIVAALVPGTLASLLGISVERLQLALAFIPIFLLMIGLSVGLAYVAYSILLEAREDRGKGQREEAGR
jgi:hypothetical protein